MERKLKQLRSVDEALLLLIEEYSILKEAGKRNTFFLFTIQEIAKKMHKFYWKYRDIIVKEIQEWAKKQKENGNIYVDMKGRKWKITYGEQMYPVYGSFFEVNNVFDSLDIIGLHFLGKVEGKL